jgi:hypothetical protein
MSEVIEAEIRNGELEVECIIRRADGTVKSREMTKRHVTFRLDQTGDQITNLQEVK